MRRKKVSIIGAGFVGSTSAHWIVEKRLADVVLIDINEGQAQGKALDLFQSTSIEGADVHVQGGSDYSLTQNSDVVVITAGSPRKEGMSRDDLLKINGAVVKQVCQHIQKTSPTACVIVVSNPLDAMTYQAGRTLPFPKNKIMGMAGILDTARFKAFVSEELNISVRDIQTLVLGGHGDTMVPVLSQTFAGHRLLETLVSKEKLQQLVERTQKGGGELVRLLKTGSAYFAPSRGVVEMVEALLMDQKRILPCTVFLNGEYGYKDICIGVPCQLGKQGVEKIIETPLSETEKQKFHQSVQAIQSNQKKLKELVP